MQIKRSPPATREWVHCTCSYLQTLFWPRPPVARTRIVSPDEVQSQGDADGRLPCYCHKNQTFCSLSTFEVGLWAVGCGLWAGLVSSHSTMMVSIHFKISNIKHIPNFQQQPRGNLVWRFSHSTIQLKISRGRANMANEQ